MRRKRKPIWAHRRRSRTCARPGPAQATDMATRLAQCVEGDRWAWRAPGSTSHLGQRRHRRRKLGTAHVQGDDGGRRDLLRHGVRVRVYVCPRAVVRVARVQRRGGQRAAGRALSSRRTCESATRSERDHFILAVSVSFRQRALCPRGEGPLPARTRRSDGAPSRLHTPAFARIANEGRPRVSVTGRKRERDSSRGGDGVPHVPSPPPPALPDGDEVHVWRG